MVKTGKNTSLEIRKLVIFHREKGKSIREIAEIVSVKRSTVHYICKKYAEDNTLNDKRRSGRPKKITQTDEKFLIREIKQNPKLSSTELNFKLKEFSGKDVSSSAIRKKLIQSGFISRVARRKPALSDVNIRKRLAFAKKFKNEDVDFWKKVIFADESKFCLFGSDSKQQRVRRQANTELKQNNLCTTVKHGGGNVMVWGCMGYNGVGNLKFIDGTLDKRGYLNILKENLKASAEKLNVINDFYFYQDNDSKHTAWDVRMWLLHNCPHVIETPSQSPDLNPIEHLWAKLEREIRKRGKITNIAHLKMVINEEWQKIPQPFVKKLVESIPRRINEVMKQKGRHTKY